MLVPGAVAVVGVLVAPGVVSLNGTVIETDSVVTGAGVKSLQEAKTCITLKDHAYLLRHSDLCFMSSTSY